MIESDNAVSQAKSILLDNVVIPEDDDKKRNRKGLNKKLNTMKDILNLFLVMTLEDLPLFVASDLSNLPPLSMDNFDMSSVVREMEIIKNQMRIMQEVQETSLKDHAALCDDKSREHHEDHDEQSSVGQSPAPSTGATPLRQSPHTPEMSPPAVDDTMRTPIQPRRIDDDGGTDEDILLLTQLQGRIPFSPNRISQQRSAAERQPTTPADADRHRHRSRERHMSINRERERRDIDMTHNSHRDEDRRGSHMAHNRHVDENRYTFTEHRGWPNYRDDRYNRNNPRDRSNRRINMHTRHDNKKENRSARNTVITGTSNSRTLTAATPRNTQQKDYYYLLLFISRLLRHTRATDVVSYIRNEANLNLRCDPVPTKYDSYRSYYIHAHPRHHGLLLKPGMWPKNVIVRPYSSD